MGGPKNKAYKRSWKNLLLNKQYQLSFTLLMVGVAAILMVGLGWWVNQEAQQATQIFLNDVKDCRVAPDGAEGAAVERERSDSVELDIGEMTMVEPEGEGDPSTPAAPGAASAQGERAGEGVEGPPAEAGMEAPPASADVPPEPAPTIGTPILDRSQWQVDPECQKLQAQKRQELLDGQQLILYVMIGVGLLLIIGLTLYGIKMTHKVAGPLHKVSLYLAKMKDGKLDTVYNLRKGDQLVDFYAHFKGAHAGIKKMQEQDVERLNEIIEAAEAENLGDKSPEIAAALEELKEIVKRKEEGLV